MAVRRDDRPVTGFAGRTEEFIKVMIMDAMDTFVVIHLAPERSGRTTILSGPCPNCLKWK